MALSHVTSSSPSSGGMGSLAQKGHPQVDPVNRHKNAQGVRQLASLLSGTRPWHC